MSGDAAELDPKVDTGLEVGGVLLECNRIEGDIVGVGTDRDGSAGVVRDIKFPGHPVQVPIVENGMVHSFGIRHDIHELVFIKTGRRGGRDVSDIVGSRPF